MIKVSSITALLYVPDFEILLNFTYQIIKEPLFQDITIFLSSTHVIYGVEIDLAQSNYLLMQSALLGNQFAQVDYGTELFYKDHESVKNKKRAIEYYKKAATQNNAMAQAFLSRLYYCGIKEIIEPNHAQAFDLATNAAKENNPLGRYILCLILKTGIPDVVQKNNIECLSQLKLAAKAKYEPAVDLLNKLQSTSLGKRKLTGTSSIPLPKRSVSSTGTPLVKVIFPAVTGDQFILDNLDKVNFDPSPLIQSLLTTQEQNGKGLTTPRP